MLPLQSLSNTCKNSVLNSYYISYHVNGGQSQRKKTFRIEIRIGLPSPSLSNTEKASLNLIPKTMSEVANSIGTAQKIYLQFYVNNLFPLWHTLQDDNERPQKAASIPLWFSGTISLFLNCAQPFTWPLSRMLHTVSEILTKNEMRQMIRKPIEEWMKRDRSASEKFDWSWSTSGCGQLQNTSKNSVTPRSAPLRAVPRSHPSPKRYSPFAGGWKFW